MASLETEIDRLYQLPLNEFTAARAALAKRAGSNAADVRALPKPTLPAWAVNRLYWQERATYDRLVRAAERLRTAHKAVLEGRKADLREPDKTHDEAVDAALRQTLAILEQSDHPVTAATRDAVSRTLHALPVGEANPGRLTKPLAPGGFDLLAGITPAKHARVVAFPEREREEKQRETKEEKKRERARAAALEAQAAKERAERRKSLEAAERRLREARRAEARAREEVEEAARAVDMARAAVGKETD